ncbi:MAG: LexA family transcriptional regulator [Candidatus Thiodiazotropha endolucinida]
MDEIDRIDKLLKERGLKWADLARAIDVSDQVTTNWKKRKNIPKPKLALIAEYLLTTMDYLNKGIEVDDYPFPQKHSAKFMRRKKSADGTTEPPPDYNALDQTYAFIPRLSVQAAAGTGYDNHDIHVMDTLAFRRDWLIKRGFSPDKLEIYEAVGDSMAPYIIDGDMILIQITDEAPAIGEVWAIWQADYGIRVKRLLYTERGELIIRSDNPDKSRFPDEIVAGALASSEVRTLGKVVWRGG